MQSTPADPIALADPNRYARQIALPGFGLAAQRSLAATRVLVIGAGGLGSTVIPALTAAGVGTIGIVDDDTVELSNLHRQYIHGTADVGIPKVVSAANRAHAINPASKVIAIETRLTAENALGIFADYDLVLDGSDNFPTRYLANDAAAITGIPLVWGAVAQYAGQVGLAWAAKGPQYRDLFPTPPPAGSVLSCEQGGVFPTVVAVIGALMAGEALKVLTGSGTPLLGRVTTFDALTGAFRELAYESDPTASSITELIDYDAFCGVVPRASTPESESAMSDTISPSDLAASIERGDDIVLLDVREPWEAEIASLPDSLLVPLGSLESVIDKLDPSENFVVYCHHGMRSESALRVLQQRGFEHARHLTGGIDAWSRDVDGDVARY
ncbi:adenylyltransferase/sulfurtransferase MoeZ [Conyzicola nivalis]|uniref:Adenylyltransferase/sulfurtransferase MoeZ n=1 Tax=Conyzicola nivalis TaxID=1477021 RepID=A0A916SIV6_9MICO|nr:ThiF family adenylyltransferase [Conyzicola nivalis]GGB02479.1 adenylyltransferase/sulfurtransferase MoeZ [Conyzicola nivalis]